jgi:small subunit ribosomal protein S16
MSLFLTDHSLRIIILLNGGEALPVSIRLKRFGRKKRPFYRVVVADSRDPRQGNSVEDIGFYNPLIDPAEILINEDKALKWLKDGAKPTDTVKSLLSKTGIMRKFHEQKQSGKTEENTQEEASGSE